MILLRLLLLASLIWLIWAIWRRVTGRVQSQAPEQLENMVKCARCEQHVPEHMAIKIDGRHYCEKHKPDSGA